MNLLTTSPDLPQIDIDDDVTDREPVFLSQQRLPVTKAGSKAVSVFTVEQLSPWPGSDNACQQIKDGKLTLHHRIEVVAEDQRPVFTLPFRSAFNIED